MWGWFTIAVPTWMVLTINLTGLPLDVPWSVLAPGEAMGYQQWEHRQLELENWKWIQRELGSHSQHPKSSSSLCEWLQSSWGKRVWVSHGASSWIMTCRIIWSGFWPAIGKLSCSNWEIWLHFGIAGIDHPLYSRTSAMVKLHRISGSKSCHHHELEALQLPL